MSVRPIIGFQQPIIGLPKNDISIPSNKSTEHSNILHNNKCKCFSLGNKDNDFYDSVSSKLGYF